MTKIFSRRWLIGAASVLMLAATSAFAQPAVRVSSKIDTEGSLLGNMIIQVLAAHGIPTENKLQLGTTKIMRAAIIAGEIDIYPEYTGNGAFFFSDEKNPAWKNAKAGYELVKKLDAEKNHLVWLTPAPADNTWAIALRKDVAQKNHVKSLADLAKWLAAGGKFKLAASAEFIERSDALPAFEKAYGFKLTDAQLLTLAGGNTTATIKAAAQGTSGVNAAMAYGTDGALAALGLVVLDDPKNIQPVYAPTPLVREATLARYPQIKELLASVFRTLDGATLRGLNAKIAVNGEDAGKVATDYLRAKGFIK
ncbi:MAG TPA: ABC transporter substrate-binding protein [Casimicrobiaceae bacterium]